VSSKRLRKIRRYCSNYIHLLENGHLIQKPSNSGTKETRKKMPVLSASCNKKALLKQQLKKLLTYERVDTRSVFSTVFPQLLKKNTMTYLTVKTKIKQLFLQYQRIFYCLTVIKLTRKVTYARKQQYGFSISRPSTRSLQR
jgi:hypothetical protein